MISIGVIGSSGKSAIIEIVKNELFNNGKTVVIVEANGSQSCSNNCSGGGSSSSSSSNGNNRSDCNNSDISGCTSGSDCNSNGIGDGNGEGNGNSEIGTGSRSDVNSRNISGCVNSSDSEVSNSSKADFMITSISSSSNCMLDNLNHPIKFDILIQTAIEEKSNEIIEGLQNAVMCIKENGYFIFDSDFIQKINFPCESIYAITYGLNGRTTITTSSIDDTEKLTFHYCLQRSIISLTESIIQPFEIPIKVDGKYSDVNCYLAAYTCLLILGYKF